MKKILVANRGEIALRVMRTAKKMGIQTVAVYSEVDRHAPHVRFADEAVLLGPPPSNQSYLLIDKIIEAAKNTGADAIHPGYGLLSENPAFAAACTRNQIAFVGPIAATLQQFGEKAAARAIAIEHDVPVLKGTVEPTNLVGAREFFDMLDGSATPGRRLFRQH